MGDSKNINILDDDMLDSVSGGAERTQYDDRQLRDAGINVATVNGQKRYTYLLNGRLISITKDVALSITDAYYIGGGQRLSDEMVKALIQQS